MNAWFERYLAGLGAGETHLTGEEAKLVLELAGDAAHTSGARQFAPLAAYLAGLVAGRTPGSDPIRLLQQAARAAQGAGAAGEELDLG